MDERIVKIVFNNFCCVGIGLSKNDEIFIATHQTFSTNYDDSLINSSGFHSDIVGMDADLTDSGYPHSSAGSADTFQTNVPNSPVKQPFMASTFNDDVFSMGQDKPNVDVTNQQTVANGYWSKAAFTERECLSHASDDTGFEVDMDMEQPESPNCDLKKPCCKTISKDSGVLQETELCM